MLGNVLAACRRYGDALAAYDRITDRDPGFSWAWFNRANMLAALRRQEEALSSFDKFTLVTSEAVTEEISKIPDVRKRPYVEKIVSIANEGIHIDDAIMARMHEILAEGGDAMDSLHIACAESAGAVLLTTNDGLIIFFKSNRNIHIRIENPVTWIQEEN